ncbi:MAG TPA: bifunctional phosphoribosylaminoimidazolecarboxamide formyltransferase/IMP cyclohydrolase [Burkholderiales bacterium]|nr:bifunctional phosphoribosylaminoimidazolecarboxamide formyltransferase/IMP cyclohydrolase [Burkholderiales bacterium]
MSKINRALLSVSDKTGLVDFAEGLRQFGVELLSTGGTAKLLKEAGIKVTEIGDYTGFPEMLGGRVKTLHPKIHGGILARRDREDDLAALEKAGILQIDLVVVNLYPFKQTIANPQCTLAEAIENIDIGGPTMLRSAAKNHASVAAIVDPADYPRILVEMKTSNGELSEATRFRLAQKVFSHTAQYDGAISNYLTSTDPQGNRAEFPERMNLQFELAQKMRYGENPHQKAAFYRDVNPARDGLAQYQQIQGKELSYNNIADSDAAWECVKTFEQPTCVIIKHANPCGVAIGPDLLTAYKKAFSCDPVSAFGGIIAFNGALDEKVATAVIEQFVEVVIAPEITDAAKGVLAEKSNVRVLAVPPGSELNEFDFKRVGGGLLIQTPDDFSLRAQDLRVVSKRRPSTAEIEDLVFAWRVAKFVKSNAIVFCGNGQTLGVGAGQMSRIDSARIASIKAKNAGLDLSGSVVASDAFFPFRDGVDVIAEAGAKAIAQPGGSLRDEEVIAAADEHGMAMVFTGYRHFRH